MDDSGKETYDGAIGLLRYIIANGDTSVRRYRRSVDPATTAEKEQEDPSAAESYERNKYLIYGHFEEYHG